MTMPSSSPRRTWRPGTPGSAGKPSRRFLLVLLTGIVLVLLGGLAAWLTLFGPPPSTRFLPLALSEYGEEFPVRAYPRQDMDALRSAFGQDRETFTVQQRDKILQELEALQKFPAGSPLVVYLGAYARARPGDGQLCLLPVDARLEDPASWLPLEQVFALLRKCPARHKLLLLDVMQSCLWPPAGLLVDEAAGRLEPLLKQELEKDRGLSVLCACSPGQVSLTSEELGQSLFGYFLARGLAGDADAATGTPANRRVSMKELSVYVCREVDAWAARHLGTRQTPRLYGGDTDFVLVQPEGASEEETGALSRDYLAALVKGWERRDQWWKEQVFRSSPRAYLRLESALLRAEQQWRGGLPRQAVEDQLRAGEQEAARLREQTRPVEDTSEPTSAVQAAARRREPVDTGGPDVLGDLRRLLVLHARAVAPKADPALGKQLDMETEAWLKKFTGKPLELSLVVHQLAGEDRLTPAGLTYLLGALAKGKAPPYLETKLLERLARLPVDERAGPWPAEAVRLAVRCTREVEQAATFSPPVRTWGRAALSGPAQRLREGETLLFAPDRKARARAGDVLQNAWDGYRAAVLEWERIREAREVLQEAIVLLPGFAGYLDVDDRLETTWHEAVMNTLQLRKILSSPPPATAADLAERTKTLAELSFQLRDGPDALRRLRQALEPDALKALIRRSDRPADSDLRDMRAWLQTPWPNVKERLDLWRGWRQACAAGVVRGGSVALPEWDERTAAAMIAQEQKRGLDRARRSVDLLRLFGLTDLESLTEALAQAKGKPDDRAALDRLSAELRRGWQRSRQHAPDENKEFPR